MKNIFSIPLVITMFMAFTFVSCRKNSASADKTNGLRFTNLSSEKTIVQAGTTTKVAASVKMRCMCMCTTDYTWTTSAGTISGSGAEVVFNAPSTVTSAQITCSVSHCCNKQELTKNISIIVQ